MDEAAKKTVLRMIPYGLYVLGAKQGEAMSMATINWVTQASFAPPLVVLGVKADAGGHALLKATRQFALSMLKSGQKDMAYAFFKPVAPQGNMIGGFEFALAGNGSPVLTAAAGYVAGTIHEIVERGDHSVFVGEVTEARLHGAADILTLKEIGANYGG
ncbi:MAG: flavin reductase family protein [Candidatus Lambdaproteobacteria bacterium]|nr:flavin reductase family protein [Candidatus Lambdaproteobacteria bacterium]